MNGTVPGVLLTLVAVLFAVWQLVHRKRRKRWTVSASSVAAAIGVHPYKSQTDLWRELTGRQVVETSEMGEKAMLFGREHERRAFQVYQTLYGGDVVDGNKYGILYSPSLPWLRGYADGLIFRGAKVEGILEIKCRFSQSDNAVPYQKIEDMFYHLPQVQCYMEMTNSSFCDLMSYTKRGSTVFRIQRDLQLFYLIQVALERFRKCLIEDTEPLEDMSLANQIRPMLLNCHYETPPAQNLF